jgi:hypothetical protein
MRIHCKKNHQQVWKGEKSLLYNTVKVQSFFRSRRLQKYFIIKVGAAGNRENLDQNQVVN